MMSNNHPQFQFKCIHTLCRPPWAPAMHLAHKCACRQNTQEIYTHKIKKYFTGYFRYILEQIFFSALELQAVKPGLPLSLGLIPAHFPEETAELWRVCGTFRGTLAADDRTGDKTQVPCQLCLLASTHLHEVFLFIPMNELRVHECFESQHNNSRSVSHYKSKE